MKSKYIKKILRLIQDDGAQSFLDLLLGDSPLRVSHAIRISSEDEKIAYRMVIEHLRFISRFGDQQHPVKEGKKTYFPYPEYLEKWLELGMPGVEEVDLKRFFESQEL